MFRMRSIHWIFLGCITVLVACTIPRRTTPTTPPSRPGTTQTKPKPTNPGGTTPTTTPPKPVPNSTPTPTTPTSTTAGGQTYRVAVLLPFLTDQFDANTGAVPEKSTYANQFYAGTQLALQQLSKEGGLNMQVDVLDSRVSDSDFQTIMQNVRLQKAQVIIGPIRSSQVSIMAERIKTTHQILISPESPSMDLTARNPDFLQVNPSLKSHCEAIVQHIRRTKPGAEVVLLCKQKEAERLAYFQSAVVAQGGTKWPEIVVPDGTNTPESSSLSRYFRAGRTTVVVVPSWGNQDFIMGILRQVKAVRGSARAEVYGMPQWVQYENIDPDYLSALNVHISKGGFVDYNNPDVKAFQRQFYEAYGTIPDEDAFNGYDIALYTGRMLRRYGLSFPQSLPRESLTEGLFRQFRYLPVNATTPLDAGGATNTYDYLENRAVRILHFDKAGFVLADE